MAGKVTFFLPTGTSPEFLVSLQEIKNCELTDDVFVLIGEGEDVQVPPGFKKMVVPSLFAAKTIRQIAGHCTTKYFFLYTRALPLLLGTNSISRMVKIAGDTGAGLIYADYREMKGDNAELIPVIDYQYGSLRDDFNFGPLLLFKTSAFKEAAGYIDPHFMHAGLYDLRLKLSQKYTFFHLPEYLYTSTTVDKRRTAEQQFDYVNPRNRKVQIEMEKACTRHLKDIGGWLKPDSEKTDFNLSHFKAEASVIIPVKNRVKTISDAIHSALGQQCDFAYNVIVVDNHSDDGTTEIVGGIAKSNTRLIHIIPGRNDLGIGGCWNEALFHKSCGKFAVQLDSDDLYIDDFVLKKIVTGFYEQKCAMLIGSYKMVDFNLNEIPPGIIDHREWTSENGRNNALRINGLGAPRAFYTPIARSISLPNVSYGEDYAIGLQISRHYQIGRIYEPLYLCRRWEENSDASPDIIKFNAFNMYKDKIRTIELLARQQMIQEKESDQ